MVYEVELTEEDVEFEFGKACDPANLNAADLQWLILEKFRRDLSEFPSFSHTLVLNGLIEREGVML